MRRRLLVAVTFVLSLSGTALADGVNVNYAVSGSPNNWTLDFDVTNNLAPASQDVYFFGVLLSANNVVNSPINYDPTVWPVWNNQTQVGAGSNHDYNNNWIDFTYNSLLPGTTLSGFEVQSSDDVAPSAVDWFAFAFSPTGDAYTGGGSFFDTFSDGTNPGFEGVVNSVSSIPEPSSLILVGTGVLALAGFRRRKAATLVSESAVLQPEIR